MALKRYENTRPKVGLAQNPRGVPFRCGTCEFFGRKKPGLCDNPDPELQDREVDAITECCDLYHHPGMKIIVK